MTKYEHNWGLQILGLFETSDFILQRGPVLGNHYHLDEYIERYLNANAQVLTRVLLDGPR